MFRDGTRETCAASAISMGGQASKSWPPGAPDRKTKMSKLIGNVATEPNDDELFQTKKKHFSKPPDEDLDNFLSGGSTATADAEQFPTSRGLVGAGRRSSIR